MNISREQLADAVDLFQDSYEDYDEYGLCQDDAEVGVLVVLAYCGIGLDFDLSPAQCKRIAEAHARVEKRRAEVDARRVAFEAERARRAALTPKQHKEEDARVGRITTATDGILRDALADNFFGWRRAFDYLREKRK